MKATRRSFKGGYRFKRFAGTPQPKLAAPPVPQKVTIPLRSRGEADFIVEVGDRVAAGQIITDQSVLGPILSSINGEVDRIDEIDLFGSPRRAVVIQGDGSPEWHSLSGHGPDWSSLAEPELRDLVYRSGVTALGTSGIPIFSDDSKSPQVASVIIHHTGSEMYSSSLSVLWEGDGFDHFREGLLILNALLPKAKIHLAVGSNDKGWIRHAETRLGDTGSSPVPVIDLIAVESKYPQHFEEILVSTCLNNTVPFGSSVSGMGVLTVDVSTIQHLYEAVVEGKPLIEKIITLSGPGFENPTHVRVRLGSPISEFLGSGLKEKELRLVRNSLLHGETITDTSLPVTLDCEGIISVEEGGTGVLLPFARPGFRQDSHTLSFAANYLPFEKECTTNINGERRACISCGFCSDVCPSRLFPQMLHRYVERNIINEKLKQYDLMSCIECHLCTYVCPTKVPVSHLIIQGKGKLIEEGFVQEADGESNR